MGLPQLYNYKYDKIIPTINTSNNNISLYNDDTNNNHSFNLMGCKQCYNQYQKISVSSTLIFKNTKLLNTKIEVNDKADLINNFKICPLVCESCNNNLGFKIMEYIDDYETDDSDIDEISSTDELCDFKKNLKIIQRQTNERLLNLKSHTLISNILTSSLYQKPKILQLNSYPHSQCNDINENLIGKTFLNVSQISLIN